MATTGSVSTNATQSYRFPITRTIAWASCGLTIASAVCCAHAAPNQRSALMSRETSTREQALLLLNRAKDALGGTDRLDRITAFRVLATRETTGSRGIEGVANRADYSAHWPLTFEWPNHLAPFVAGETLLPPSHPSTAATPDIAPSPSETRSAYLAAALLFLGRVPSSPGSALRIVEPPANTGLAGQGVELTDMDDIRLILVIDPATGRPVGIARSLGLPSGSQRYPWRVLRVDDHQTIDGLIFPRRLTVRTTETVETLWITDVLVTPDSAAPHR